MPDITDANGRWLSHAREMLVDEVHRKRCESSGGARPSQPQPFSNLRWPGYIGDRYARILCLGMIHNGGVLFAGRRTGIEARQDRAALDASVLDLEPVVIEWLRDDATDDQYLAQSRTTYSRALPYWPTWKHISPILKQFGYESQSDQLRSIAYANIAKCWSDTDDESRSDVDVMTCCNNWNVGSSIALVKAIRPVCILIATTRAGFSRSDLPLLEDGYEADVWAYNFRTGVLKGVKGEESRREIWAQAAAEQYAKRMQRFSGGSE